MTETTERGQWRWHHVPSKSNTFCRCEDGLHGPDYVAFWGATTLLNHYSQENGSLRAALEQAKATIRTWHGIGMPDSEAEEAMWQAYQKSPEMREINAALESTKGVQRQAGETKGA